MKAELYWVGGPWPGKLAIAPRPRGADWLEDELRSWKSQGIDVVVSALENDEIQELDLAKEPEMCQEVGIQFVPFPIPDRGLPGSKESTAKLIPGLAEQLKAGHQVLIHCRQGIGRASLLAAALMTVSGTKVAAAFEQISRARGREVPDTPEQRQWVEKFAKEIGAAAAKG